MIMAKILIMIILVNIKVTIINPDYSSCLVKHMFIALFLCFLNRQFVNKASLILKKYNNILQVSYLCLNLKISRVFSFFFDRLPVQLMRIARGLQTK